jgi:hypothetical protein
MSEHILDDDGSRVLYNGSYSDPDTVGNVVTPINRVEYIGKDGCEFSRSDRPLRFSIQDDGMTLKIFEE